MGVTTVVINEIRETVAVATRGPQGPPGSGGGGGGGFYLHTQAITSGTWVINHNLGQYPAIQLFDVSGRLFSAEIIHNSTNQSTVSVSPAIAGSAVCTT